MHYRRIRRPSKPAVFAMLMAMAAVLALLPKDFLSPFRNVTQLVAVPQYGATAAARGISKSASVVRSTAVPQAEHAEALTAKQAVENENLSLRRQVLQLQELVGELQQVRGRSQFPSNARLIPARVVGWDAVPGRDTLALLKGRSPAVRQGDWIASSMAVECGSENGMRQDDLRVLARQTLIGWIEQTAPYTSRAVLLSDPYSRRKWYVNIYKVGRSGQSPTLVMQNGRPVDFALEGIGKGKMRILDVNAKFINDGLIRLGDVVTTDGRDPKLPVPMVIGEIIELQQIKKQPLLYNAIVKHRCDPKDIGEVLIVDIPR